jgi:hypothetical protein
MRQLRTVKWLFIPLVYVLIHCRSASVSQEAFPPQDSTQPVALRPDVGEIRVEAVVDSPRVPSNHTLTLTIRASCLGDINRFEFQWPDPPDLDRFEIVGSSSGNVVKQGRTGELVNLKEFRYVLRPVGQGRGRIGSVQLSYTDRLTQKEYALSTRAISVEVTEPVVGGSTGSRTMVVLLIGLLAIALIGGVVFFVRRDRIRREAVGLPVEAKGPEELALERLEGVSDLRMAGETKEYYSEISSILRDYIDRRFFLRTTELTSPDIVGQLRLKGMEEETIAEIEKIFKVCDMVKFARHEPAPADLDTIYSMAWDFFTRSTPDSPEAVDEDAGPGKEGEQKS